eukprot:scaffold31329_cov37-Phaeocystis_antarctica.AAC.1
MSRYIRRVLPAPRPFGSPVGPGTSCGERAGLVGVRVGVRVRVRVRVRARARVGARVRVRVRVRVTVRVRVGVGVRVRVRARVRVRGEELTLARRGDPRSRRGRGCGLHALVGRVGLPLGRLGLG